MMIEIQQEMNEVSEINREMLIFAIEQALAFNDKKDVDLSLRLTTDDEIHQLNLAFRGMDQATDVLSFNQDLIDPESGRLYLGDIVISLEKAAKQALEHDHSLDEECAFLAIHGTLHLLGYDHAEKAAQERMWKIQDELFLKVIHQFQGE